MALITVPVGAGGAAGAGGAGAGFAVGAGAGVVGAAPLFEAGAPLAAVLLVAEPGAAPEVVLPAVGEAVEGAEAGVALALLAATGDELELRPPQAIVASIKLAISTEAETRNNLELLNFRFGPSGGRAICGALDGKRNRDYNRDQVNFGKDDFQITRREHLSWDTKMA
jgi:hypothetical protein